jgi:hypothetical protein
MDRRRCGASAPVGKEVCLGIHRWLITRGLDAHPTAVWAQLPGLGRVSEVQEKDVVPEGVAKAWVFHGEEHLDAVVEVARHEVRAPHEQRRLTPIVEVVHPYVFKEPSHDGRDPDGVAHPLEPWS